MQNSNNKSNQRNANKNTSGTNDTYQKVLDNRSRQLNPNNPLYNGKK